MGRLVLALFLMVVSQGAAVKAEPAAGRAGEDAKPWLGVIVDDAVDGGVLVVAVHPTGPADRSGLKSGDVVIRVDGREVADQEAFVEDLLKRKAGSPLSVEVLRGGTRLAREIVLGSRQERIALLPPLAPEAPLVAELPASPPLALYGVRLVEVTPDLREHFGAPPGTGVLVTRVDADAAQALSGLRVGDVLIAIDGEPVSTANDVQTLLVARHGRGESGSALTATLVRAGARQEVEVDLPPVSRAAEAVASKLREVALEEELRRLRGEAERLAHRIATLEQALATVRGDGAK